MKPLEHRNLQCIYCDDLRNEVDGKTTIVGWYPVEPVKLPAEGELLLPSLCVVGTLVVPLESKLTDMTIELLQDENVLNSVTVPSNVLHETQQEGLQSPGPLRAMQLRIVLRLLNLRVPEPGMLRMRITVDDEVLEGNSLRFAR